MNISVANNKSDWESFLKNQKWSPFLQSWTMGEVYESLGQEVVRLEVRDDSGEIVGVCQGVVVPARRGKHLAVSYGPVLSESGMRSSESGKMLVSELKRIASDKCCAFVRVSPFWPKDAEPTEFRIPYSEFPSSPLHMLAEHIWYLNLRGKSEEDIFAGMRKNTRNLIRRAEREGVTVKASDDPVRDLPIFIALHEETRKRHGFTPYTDEFFEQQVEKWQVASGKWSEMGCVMYIARYNNEPVAASIHMIYGGETSYHHGASTSKYPKCFASYLLQWTAIKDALARGDHVFNFWGVSPEGVRKHPFAGVRTFKTGFGGQLLELVHCVDLPLSNRYWGTWVVETLRKWRRGF